MTITASDMAFYAGALLILFLTPGPVWVALTARTLSGGFHAAWPLAMGVVVGDVLWPFLAILGVTWIVGVFAGFMTLLRWVACLTFLTMGVLIIRHAGHSISSSSRLTRPGMWAGFVAGLAVILGNPKAILFYMGVLPGFFNLPRLDGPIWWPSRYCRPWCRWQATSRWRSRSTGPSGFYRLRRRCGEPI